jgi:hypothetical protein
MPAMSPDGAQPDAAKKVPATEVRPGDHIRLASGIELEVSHIEAAFLGMPAMIAFIEDTPERWFKAPVPTDAEVEIL